MDIININDSIIEKEKQLKKLQNDIANLKKQEEQQILEKNTTIFLNSIYNIKLIEYDSIYLNSNKYYTNNR